MKNSIKKEKNLVRQWFYSLSLSSSHSISISTFFLHLLLPLVTPRSDLTISGEDSSLLNNMNSQRIFFIIPFLGNILRILFDLGQFFFDRNVSSIRQLVFSLYSPHLLLQLPFIILFFFPPSPIPLFSSSFPLPFPINPPFSLPNKFLFLYSQIKPNEIKSNWWSCHHRQRIANFNENQHDNTCNVHTFS